MTDRTFNSRPAPPKGRDLPSDKSANRDPLSGTPGAHPVGTGVGAVAGGAAAGAAVGTVAGPVGTVVGAAAGAVAGGLAGKGVAEAIDPTREDDFWRNNYSNRPYVQSGASYDDYGPAYGFGVDAFGRYPGQTFEQAEPDMSRSWNGEGGSGGLSWDSAKEAVRDAWNRLQRNA